MCRTGDSAILDVPGYVVCFFGVETCVPATYFLLYYGLPTYTAASLNCPWPKAKRCLCFNETA